MLSRIALSDGWKLDAKVGGGEKGEEREPRWGSSEDGRGQTESTESPDKLGKQEAGSCERMGKEGAGGVSGTVIIFNLSGREEPF